MIKQENKENRIIVVTCNLAFLLLITVQIAVDNACKRLHLKGLSIYT